MDANELQDLVKRFQENRDFIKNEETAKMALVVPFIRLLGYDTNIPREVRLEFCATFAQGDGKKQPDRMDFAIFDKTGAKPLIVIETKPLGTDLRRNSNQLARYISQLPDLHFGIMTDGCHYLFFGDLENQNVMDVHPFFSFSLDDPKTDWAKVATFLTKFSREAFNAETLVTDAENARYRQAIIERLVSALKAPTEDKGFLDWLTSDIYKGIRTAKVMTRLTELAKDAIEPAILRCVGDGLISTLRERIASAQPVPDVAQKAPVEPAVTAAVETSRPVETSAEELEFFSVVQELLSTDGINPQDLLYKDTTNYFNVSYKKPTKWFVRFFSATRRKSLTTPLPIEELRVLCSGMEVEESPASFGTSRVYIDSVQQVKNMKAVLIKSLQVMQGSG